MKPLTSSKAASLYQTSCQARGYKDNTIKTAMANLKPFFIFLEQEGIDDLRDVERGHLISFLHEIELHYAENTRRSMLISIRRLFSVLYEEQKIISVPTDNIVFKAPSPAPREILSEKQMDLFLYSIDTSARQGLRDKALFELMYSSGLRSRESARLLVGDINLEARQAHIRAPKNRQDRLVPITDIAAFAIEEYLPNKVDPQRPLFLSDQGGHLRPSSINRRFLKWVKVARVYHQRLSVHSLRHSCARHLLSHGAHLRFVQELLGHKSVESTEIYTMENDENLKRVYKQYHPRENSIFVEVDDAYLENLDALQGELEYFIGGKDKIKIQ